MPTMPISIPKANQRLQRMCTMLTVTAVSMGNMVFCIPVNQPLNPKSTMPAGTAQMRA